LLQAGIPEAQGPRYGWKDAKAGESSRLLSSTSLSNTSLNNGYISDNGPLNANSNNNNNNNNNNVACTSGYRSVGLGGYASSDSEGGGGGGERRLRVSGGVDRERNDLPALPAAGTSIGLVNLGTAIDSNDRGFHNPLEGVSEDERLSRSNTFPGIAPSSLLETDVVTHAMNA